MHCEKRDDEKTMIQHISAKKANISSPEQEHTYCDQVSSSPAVVCWLLVGWIEIGVG